MYIKLRISIYKYTVRYRYTKTKTVEFKCFKRLSYMFILILSLKEFR